MSAGAEPFLGEGTTEAALQEVLAEPPFGQSEIGRELINRLVDWYDQNVVSLQVDHPVIFWTVMTLLSVLLIFLLWHVGISVRSVWRAMRSSEDGSAVEEEAVGRGDLEPARAALREGAYRTTIELAWAAVAEAWTRPGERARTPRRQARLLIRRMDAVQHPTLSELLQLHERACYAGAAPDASAAHEALTRAAALVHEAERG